MTTAVRAATIFLAVVSIGLAAAGSVHAASPAPDTVGGRLAAVGNTVSVTAQGSLPVHVTMTADVVSLSVEAFDLLPGETRDLTFTGDPLGRVYATFSAGAAVTSADSNSLTLSVGLKPYVPPFDPTVPGGIGLFVLVVILAARRLRLHELRLTRAA